MKRLSMISLLILLFLVIGQNNGYLQQTSDLNNSYRLPDYDKFVMNNGLTVYLMEQHEVPMVYVSFVFSAGAVNDVYKNLLNHLQKFRKRFLKYLKPDFLKHDL